MKDEEIQRLMMKMVDGIASPEEERAMAEAIRGDERWGAELRAFRKIREVTEAMRLEDLPDGRWDGYWEDIYRRTERALGWILLSVGLMAALGYAAWAALSGFFADSAVSGILKIGVSLALSGGIILLVSIVRERLFARKHERYEREVER
jgi:anti-sigma factor RsiW